MGLWNKIFGGGEKEQPKQAPAPPPKAAAAAAAAAAPRAEERRSCEKCGRRMLPGAPCPFCTPQHFGDGLESTMRLKFEPQVGVIPMGGVMIAHRIANEHGARGFLHVFKGPNKGESVLLGTQVVSIGRDAEQNILSLNDAGASTKHCEIRPTEAGYELVDLGSKNGTFVNDESVKQRDLQNGDSLTIGETRIHIGIVAKAKADEPVAEGDSEDPA